MPLPDFIRYFAETADTPIGRIALDYAKSLCRIADVRVVSLSGGLAGPWTPYESLTMTPMRGTYVNCVCTHPTKWSYMQRVPAPSQDFIGADAVHEQTPRDMVTGTVELYTKDVRNVLFLAKMPVVRAEIDIALKYEAIVCASINDQRVLTDWSASSVDQAFGRWMREKAPSIVVAIPNLDHNAVRVAVLGGDA